MIGKADGAPMRRLEVAAQTDIGLIRENNEDAFIVAPLGGARSHDTGVFDVERQPLLLAVSDGMGGAAAGEVASAVAVESLWRSLPADSADWAASLRGAVERANDAVRAMAREPGKHGAGATLTAVCVVGRDAYVAEVGDSRAYLIRGGELRLLTHDQSYVQLLIDAGILNPEDAERSPYKNVILSAMGQGPDIRVDIGRIELKIKDRILVCSDGLSRELTAAQLRDVLVENRTPATTCTRLIALAKNHGGADNITVIVGHLDDVG